MGEFLTAISGNADTFGIGLLLVGTLTVIFRAIATGALVFRKQLDDLTDAHEAEMARNSAWADKVIALKDQQVQGWHDAYQREAVARAEQGATLEEQLELARAGNYMLKALLANAPGGQLPGGGGS